jgi:predicted membrane channel-forming protein YqfA (hemolysin III family)
MIPWDASEIAAFLFSVSGMVALVVYMIPQLQTRRWKPIHALSILGYVLCIIWSITGAVDAYTLVKIPPNFRFTLGLLCVGIILQIHLEILKLFCILTRIRKETIRRLQKISCLLLILFLCFAVSTTWDSWNSPWDEVPFVH